VRRDLPSGTVTFLFTDVEGSTRLLHELGSEGYAVALAEHRRVIREACVSHDGVEVDTQGDAFFVAFPTAPRALAAAEEMTQELASGPIQVRVGLHTGTPLLTEEGYVGGDVHRAARIAAAGHGGQVLVSASTAALIEPSGKLLLGDLGEHRFKDLGAPERVYQLGEGEFPALKSLFRTNLPVPTTPFLGRERELAEVVGLLEGTRLLTLTGPGGTGKTRLAAQAAGLASDSYPDGVWWVPLAALREPELVLETAAQVVGSKNGLVEHIAAKSLLLLFDNFEQVVEAAGDVAGLLASCPKLDLLVTSREPLHVTGEQEYPVPPFAHEEGVGFFLARARAVEPGFQADEATSEICRRLDDLPLALELAAARVKALSSAQILERLEQRLLLLTGGARDLPERQRTLRGAIEWSYELLDQEEQSLFARLSVFRGGCTLEAAEEICDADLDTLQSLVDKSLVRFTNDRYWMLETIREFAGELLAAAPDDITLRSRHLAFYLELVEQAEPQLTGPDQRAWFERLALEQENVRDALAYACDSGDGERALMLAGTIWRFWWTRGQIDEATRWYERAFAVGEGASETARARGLFGAAHMAEARGDVTKAREQFEQAADLLRQIGATRWLILALVHLGGTYGQDRARQTYLEALALAEASGDDRGAAIAKANFANLLHELGEGEEAGALLEQALAGHRALGDAYGVATSLAGLADIAYRRGDLEDAAETLRESLQLSYSIQDTLSLSWELSLAGVVVLARGDAETGARLCAAASALHSEHGLEPDPELGDATSAVRDALGDRFDDAWARGADLDLASAVELAIDALSTET
jgi:predicted ATPase/class 3 adenylate cyclase